MLLQHLFETQIAGLNIENIRHYLRREFWAPSLTTNRTEKWNHMDDPVSLEQYVITKTFGNKVETITYTNSHDKTTRRFYDLKDFADHLSEITDEPNDPEAMARGGEKMKQIAAQLRREKDITDRRAQIRLVKK